MSSVPLTMSLEEINKRKIEKERESNRLFKMLIHGYYGDDFKVAINVMVNCFEKEGAVRINNFPGVSELDLCNTLPMTPQRVREILNKLREDQILRMYNASVDNQDNDSDVTKNLKLRKRTVASEKNKSAAYIWYVDSEHLVKVVKYRHSQIFATLNKKTDKSEINYTCPNPHCHYHGHSIPVWQFLSDGPDASKDVFRCPNEACMQLENNRQVRTPVVEIRENLDAIDKQNVELKNKFNNQLASLFAQLDKVDKILQLEEQHDIDALEESAVAEAKAAAVTTRQFVPRSIDEVLITSNTLDSTDDASAKRHNTIRAAAQAPLPFLSGESQSSSQMGNESSIRSKKKSEASLVPLPTSTTSAADEAATYEQMLAELQSRSGIANGFATDSSSSSLSSSSLSSISLSAISHDEHVHHSDHGMSEESVVMVLVQGRSVPLSSITQEDINQMTDDELAHYSHVTGGEYHDE